MCKYFRLGLFSSLIWVSCFCVAVAQVLKTTSGSDGSVSLRRGLELAKSGHCGEAVPILRKLIPQTHETALRRDGGMAGVHCAMVRNQFDAAEEFLHILNRDFPKDPEVLYVSVHTYSDLATRASEVLASSAPNSPQAHELNAESLEMQGKWEQAEKEYQIVVQQNPRLPGIHFRIGRLLLSKPNPTPDAAEQAKKEFQQELEIDPNNAGAEYVLGELARHAQQWDEAVQHFTRATTLDSGLSDAYLGWGISLVAARKFSEAIKPLESAVKLEPRNPSAHYNLAVAYTRTGRKQEGEREFAIHRDMVQKNLPPGSGPQEQPSATPQ
jgi:tetratricopeptide (TPR) repeat protein